MGETSTAPGSAEQLLTFIFALLVHIMASSNQVCNYNAELVVLYLPPNQMKRFHEDEKMKCYYSISHFSNSCAILVLCMTQQLRTAWAITKVPIEVFQK